MDCFRLRSLSYGGQLVADAPCNEGKHTLAISRRETPEVLHKHYSQGKEGAGNAGCALHPRSRVQELCLEKHTSIQVQRKHSGIPRAMALRLMSCSPRRRIRLVTVAAGLMALPIRLDRISHRQLGTSKGCRNHTILPYASAPSSACPRSLTGNPPCDSVARLTLPRPPHPVPTFVTIMIRPF